MNTMTLPDGRKLTEQEQEIFLAWLAMYPVMMEIQEELKREGRVLPHEN